MSTALVRTKFSAVAVKIETVPGVDAIGGTPALADWLGSECEVQFNPDVIDIPEYNGSLDRTASVVGGIKPTIRLRVPLRGSGAAGTAPEWGKLMRASTFTETVTAAAVGAPTAAASGTTTTVTAAAPFVATANVYRGMPLLVTGDQVFTTGIMDYTAARVITLGETRTALTVASLLQVPINVLYSPTSDESTYKVATVYYYSDGVLWTFVGAIGSPTLELTTGGIGFLSFEMRAQFGAKSITALPATGVTGAIAAAEARVQPPRFVAGKLQLNKLAAGAKTVSITAGVNIVLPDDPEASEGYGAAVPVGRAVAGSIDPYISTTTTQTLFTSFRAGTPMSLMAIIGTTPGNRILAVVPKAKAIAMDMANRDGLSTHGIQFQAEGADSPFYLASF